MSASQCRTGRVSYNEPMKYIALLRGINVGGNNKVAMAELRRCYEALGFTGVSTYINSGNVIFEAPAADVAKLVARCETAMEQQFGFRIICSIITAAELLQALAQAPDWWNKGDAKHNAIFVIAPKTVEAVMAEVGHPKPDYEQVAACQPIIFWSAPLETYGRTRYSKIVGSKAYGWVTIRNANTTTKLAELCSQA